MSNQKNSQNNYSAYFKSIFADINPNSEEVLNWKQNVLQKIKGNNILPHYISKDKDFDIFWGWIIHFFAIIVIFGRKFKDLFINYNKYLAEIREFIKEQDYIQDSRIEINKDLTVPISEEIYHKIFCGYFISSSNGEIEKQSGYNCTDFLAISEDSDIILRVLGYNENLNEFNGKSIDNIKIYLYYSDKSYGTFLGTFNLSSYQSIWGNKIHLPKSTNSNSYCYIRICYPSIGTSELPLYLGVFLEGKGDSFIINKTEKDIFAIKSNFRKRGTFKSSALIKKIIETKKEDNFYADYLTQNNVGWFLNQNSPTYGRLLNKVKIDSFLVNTISSNTIYLKEQYFTLNQNTSIIFKYKTSKVSSSINIKFNFSVYDKDKNLLSDVPILGSWGYNSSDHTLSPVIVTNNNLQINCNYNSKEQVYEGEFPIELIDNILKATFSTDTFDRNSFNQIYFFSKYNQDKSHEAYYIKLNKIICTGITVNNQSDLDISLYLRNLPINFGFLNLKQYYLCYFKNNGSYSNSEVKEIISQKVIPYNGYRIFIDNSNYKNRVNRDLDFLQINFNKISKKIELKITGGVPPYQYIIDSFNSNGIYKQNYSKEIEFGLHNIKVIDSIGQVINTILSCEPYNEINYKIRLYIDKENNIQVYIKLFGGTETSYTLSQYNYEYPYLYDRDQYQLTDSKGNYLQSTEIKETSYYYWFSNLLDSGKNQLLDSKNIELVAIQPSRMNQSLVKRKTIPANLWVDITSLIAENMSLININQVLYIIDNGFPVDKKSWLINKYNDLELNIKELFQDFAVDIYDNGKGEYIE